LLVSVGVSAVPAFAAYEEAPLQTIIAGALLSGDRHVRGLITLRQLLSFDAVSTRRSTMALRISSASILMVDPRRRIRVANRRVAELLDLPAEPPAPGADFNKFGEVAGAARGFQTLPECGSRIGTMNPPCGIDAKGGFLQRTPREKTGPVALEVRTTVLQDGSAVRTFTEVTNARRIERELGASVEPRRPGSGLAPNSSLS